MEVEPSHPFTIFISYRRAEAKGHVGALEYVLGQKFGNANVFRDAATLRPGEDFMAVIEKAVRNADVALCLMGEGWAKATDAEGNLRLHEPNDPVLIEMRTAIKRKPSVIPVLLEDAAFPALEDLPEVLQPLVRLNAYRIRDESWGEDVEELMAHLEDMRDERAGKMTGEEIKRRVQEKDRPPLWVGRNGGLSGKTLAADVSSGSWREQEYEIRFAGQLPPKNWFPAAEFVKAVADSPEGK